jgi:nucleoside-diphosphate-sugar epimerase
MGGSGGWGVPRARKGSVGDGHVPRTEWDRLGVESVVAYDRSSDEKPKTAMMRSLVTGAAGFVGSHLVEALLAQGENVRGIDSFTSYYDPDRKRTHLAGVERQGDFSFVDADLNDVDLRQLLEGVEVVYHLAGQPGVRASWGEEFDIYLAQNVLATQRLLEAAKDAPLKRFVLASSSSIYGQAESFPTPEASLPRPLSPYGVSKLAAEHLANLYHSAFGVPTVVLRYFTIFGPRQRPDMAFSRFIAAALEQRPLTVLGDGLQSRDFTYVADAVSATMAAGAKGVAGRTYNIAGGCQASVLEVVGTLEELMGWPLEREHLDPVPGDPRKTGADVSLARSDLGYEPTTTLREGLGRQLEWMRSAAGLET